MGPDIEAQKGIVSTIRDFVERDVMPVASQMEHADEYPVDTCLHQLKGCAV